MEKLLEDNCQINGQIFYITDGQPSNLYFFLDPLYSKIRQKKCTCPRLPHIPKNVTVGFSLIFNCFSKIFKQKYHLPFWGFTYMEAHKINVNHYFSIEKARKILDYHPKSITENDWKIILDSLWNKWGFFLLILSINLFIFSMSVFFSFVHDKNKYEKLAQWHF